MKKSIKYLLGAAIVVPALVSCSDFLDQNPDLRTTLDSEEKIANILVSAYVSGAGSYQLVAELSSDNVCDHGIKKDYNQFYQDVYEWAEEVTSNNDAPRNIWSTNYKNIANANQALAAIEELGGPATAKLKASKGEALLCRAYSHFVLANMFCMPYNPATAGDYMGIPYMDHAETDLNPQYERGTLREVYEKIGLDIEEGIPLLDDTSYSVAKYHFNYKAACCFASRYYLFIQDWDNAIKYATKVLTSNPESLLRDYDAIAALPNSSSRHQAYVSSSSTANFLLQAATSNSGLLFDWYSTAGRYSHGKIQGTYETVQPKKGGPWGSGVSFKAAHAVLSTSGKYVLPRTWRVFQYTDPVAGTGYNKAVSVLFCTEEALLNRAEAYIMKMSEDPDAVNSALADMNLYASNLFSAGFKPMTEASIRKWATETYPDYSELFVGKTSTSSPQTLNPKKKLHAAPYNALEEGGAQENMLQALIFMRRYQFLHEGMRWFDTRRFGITVYRYLLDEDDETVVQITDQISDENGTPDLRRALQLPADVIAAGLTPNPRNK
ncbi:RagB/SusD family nutrient uptake outer membrane protein [Alistipes timonensis]|uniref:RagB/SusD family nutrient uptake outer membrane protein n=1 Tax=Alistipes timonensis TaxID=1465754 RepID=UPI0018989D73|nr:RagB/SusD family nutrient uptake outer membrane protein [Alistipes timonensis]